MNKFIVLLAIFAVLGSRQFGVNGVESSTASTQPTVGETNKKIDTTPQSCFAGSEDFCGVGGN